MATMATMATVQDFYDFIDSFAPFSSALSFDNAGLLVGNPRQEVKRVLLSLDIPSYVVWEAAEKRIDLILSHHPVIFTPLKHLSPDQSAALLIQNGIAAICAHTNLDAADGGVNDVLCEKVGLSEIRYFSEVGRIGTLSQAMPAADFAVYIKKRLMSARVDFADAGRPVKKVAVVSGAGGDDLSEAAENGCDTLLTGEAKYHHYSEAIQKNINLIAAGHYATENPVLFALQEKLQKAFPDVQFLISEKNIQLPLSV